MCHYVFVYVYIQSTLPPPDLKEATNTALVKHGGISGKTALVGRIPVHQKIAEAIFLELRKADALDSS